MAEERTVLLKLEVDKEKSQQQLESNAVQIERNKQELSDLNKEYKKNGGSIQEYTKKKLQLTNANKELGKENRDLLKQINTEDNSLNALRQQLSRLTEERNNTNQQTAKGAKRFKELQAEILDTTTAIKGQEEAGGDFRRSVGNYQTALTNNIPILGEFQQQLEGIKAAFIAQRTVTQASVKSLGVFRVALISTGIGAIVVALGSLITFLATTQRGIDAVTSVTRPLQQIFQRLIGVVQDLGGDAFDALGKAIQNPIQALKDLGQLIVDNIINRFKALSVFGEAVAELFEGNFSNAAKLAGDAVIQFNTGITDGVDKLKNIGDQVVEFGANAIDAGTKIDELTKTIELQNIALVKLEGTNNRIFEQQKEIAENQENDIKQRIAAAREALRATTELEEKRIAQLNRRIELKKLENEANDTGNDALLEIAELERERNEAAAAAAGKRTSVNNLLNTLLKEQNTILNEQKEIERAKIEQTNIARIEAVERISIARNENEQIVKLNFDAAKAIEDSQKVITDSQREQARIRAEIQAIENENTLLAAGQVAGSLTGLFEQNSIAFKTFASIEAAISTYLAINKTLSAFASVPIPGYAIAQAVGIGIQGFANVAKINGLIGGGGGASTSGAGQATQQPRIGRTTLDGAFDRNTLTADTNNQANQTQQITDTLRNQPAPVVRVTDINKAQRNTTQVSDSNSL